MRDPSIALSPCAKLGGYQDAIRQAGGEPVVLRPDCDRPEEVAGRFGGLLLPGGNDIDPALFDQAPHPTFVPSEPGRDAFEIALLHAAARADLPVLAICRGMQVLNVAFGGSLVQDIPALLPAALPHWLQRHRVSVREGSLLRRLLSQSGYAADTFEVNSRHHQAVGLLGRGVEASGTTSDGVVEAIERPAAAFCLGVQWHPEETPAGPVTAALFAGFIRAAQRLADSREPR